ncbi:hypothetical protein D9M68_825500 [compost metagenome]
MRHDAAQARALVVQRPRDGQQLFSVAGLHARAMAVAIDFDQRGNGVAGLPRAAGHRKRGVDAIDHHGEVDAAPAQRKHALQLRGRHADRIQQVRHASRGELLGFLQRGNGGGALRRGHEPARHLDGFGRLQMGTQLHAMPRHQRVQALDITRHAGFVQQQARRIQGVHGGRGGS